MLHRLVARQKTREVQGGASRGGDPQITHGADLVRSKAFLTHDDSWSRPAVLGDQFDGRCRVHPVRAVQRGGSTTRDHRAAITPQPGGDGVRIQIRRCTLANIDPGVGRRVPPAQLTAGESTGGQRFWPQHSIVHRWMVARADDGTPRRPRSCRRSVHEPATVDGAESHSRVVNADRRRPSCRNRCRPNRRTCSADSCCATRSTPRTAPAAPRPARFGSDSVGRVAHTPIRPTPRRRSPGRPGGPAN